MINSEFVKVQQFKEKGNGLTMTKDVDVDQPFLFVPPILSVQIPSNADLYSACAHCFKPLALLEKGNVVVEFFKPPVKCDKCSLPYCSLTCKTEALPYHQYLCYDPSDKTHPLSYLDEDCRS
eukprot:TRINITY_DN8569_c0_g1_i1.p1 TRINITY_DN8569_c0_g1~~TRINITY_DN8569_c0_g1_i1.p1  ORF type:complete len:122 (-),score=20.05 TRINITY_DN8569_c0_g1_i1:156-521(-)